jgi:hypothetical protein
VIQRFSEVKDSPLDGVVQHRDIRYADHERQVIDAFLRENLSSPLRDGQRRTAASEQSQDVEPVGHERPSLH